MVKFSTQELPTCETCRRTRIETKQWWIFAYNTLGLDTGRAAGCEARSSQVTPLVTDCYEITPPGPTRPALTSDPLVNPVLTHPHKSRQQVFFNLPPAT